MKKFCNLFVAAMFAATAIVGVANADVTLVTNGDFSDPGGASWGQAAVGASFSFPAAGGNDGGHGVIDQTAGGWGGVLINDNDTPASLASLNILAGTTRTFSIDLIDLAGNGADAGFKIENWGVSGFISDSTDQVFDISETWETYTFDYAIDANATGLKFVPLLVGQSIGSSAGFDNVGVVNPVPEPGSLCVIALTIAGFAARRRRS